MKTSQMKVRMHFGLIAGAVLVVGMTATSVFAHEKMMGDMGMMKMMDTNHDGMVSAAEHAAYAKMMFDKMDTNHDGMLSQTEMAAGMKMMQGMGMHKGMMGNDHGADDSMKKSDAMKKGDGMSMHK
jgi:Ca2+-binding EF-hand superfamily protein